MNPVVRLPRAWYQADSVDEWGRDAHLIELLSPTATLRWDVSVGGIHHLPKRGGALLVTNSRRFSLSSIYTAWALSQATARPVRFGGRPDIAPLGPLLQRLGGLLDKPEEIRGALRAGELVVVSAKGTSNPRHAGPVDHDKIGSCHHQRHPGVPGCIDEQHRSAAPPASKSVRRFDRIGNGEGRWPISSWRISRSDTSNGCSMVLAGCTPA